MGRTGGALASVAEKWQHEPVGGFRGGLVFMRLLYHSTLGSTVIKKKEEEWRA
jgi:hypothetical protein